MRHFDRTSDSRELVELILNHRDKPLVVISTLDEHGAFGYDPTYVATELGDDADVITVTTGAVTYEMASLLPPRTQVYNGAARSYPPSFGQNPDYARSNLRFPDRHSVDELIEDALAQVTLASVAAPTNRAVWTKARVERVSGSIGNVAVLTDGRRVLINADRLPPDVPLASGLAIGEPIEGWLLGQDLSPEVARPDPSLFRDGDVLAARVIKATERRATVLVHPLLPPVILRRRHVIATADDEDETRVTDFVQVGQRVRVRVAHSERGLGLTMVGVDEGEALTHQIPLLRGGVPWIREDEDEVEDAAAAEPVEETEPEQPVQASAAELTGVAEPLAGAAPSPIPYFDSSGILDEINALRGAFERFSREMRAGTDLETLDRLREEISGLQVELRRERNRSAELSGRIARLSRQSTVATPIPQVSRLTGPRSQPDQWEDSESWIRHEITCAWVDRTTASDKRAHPIKAYLIGPAFAASMEALDARSFDKALRAVVDVVNGRASGIPSRELRRLRTGAGGDDPYRQRADGSWCWRVSIESGTPQARRLHFWKRPDGTVELSRVVNHDDFQP